MSHGRINLSAGAALLLASLILMGLGSAALWNAYFPRYSIAPRYSVFAWAGPQSDIRSLNVSVSVGLFSNQSLEFDFWVRPINFVTVHIDMLVPFEANSVFSFMAVNSSYFSTREKPYFCCMYNDSLINPVFWRYYPESGNTWISVNSTLLPSTGFIGIEIKSANLFTIHEPAKDTAILSFNGGPIMIDKGMPLYDVFRMNNSTYETLVYRFVQQFIVTAVFDKDKTLSADTFPSPDEIFATQDGKSPTWVLDFTRPVPGGAQSLIISVTSPDDLVKRDVLFFVAGLLLATGAGGVFESWRETISDRSKRNRPSRLVDSFS